MRWKYIINHHSLGKDSRVLNTQDIRNDHIVNREWDDIGYHFLIELVSNYYEIVVGRMLDTNGAHTLGRNPDSIGICWVGNFDIAPPSKEHWARGVQLNKSLCSEFDIPLKNIIGHRDCVEDDRSCPGKLFDLQQLRDDVAKLVIGRVVRSDGW